MRLTLEFLSLFFFLACSALLTGAEAAYFSLSRHRLRILQDKDRPGHVLLDRLLAHPHDLLVTLLVGITLINIAASALATAIATDVFGERGLGVAIGGMIFLILVFGEVLPMTLAVEHPRRFGLVAARPVLLLSTLLTPVRHWLGTFTRLAIRLVSPEGPPHDTLLTEAELKTLVEVGRQEGVVEPTEKELIHKVFALGDTRVRDVMLPRTDMFCLEVSTEPTEILRALRENLHSRVPVYEGSIDNILGILYTKELLPFAKALPTNFQLRPILHPAYFVPESKRADALLQEFQTKKIQMAIVVDEYGGTSGLVTFEDLLEELVGEIADEFDVVERHWQPLGPGVWRVSGKMPIPEFTALVGVRLVDDQFDTVGGWVSDRFGHVPHRGEAVETEGLRVTVEKVHRARVLEVTVRRLAPPEEPT